MLRGLIALLATVAALSGQTPTKNTGTVEGSVTNTVTGRPVANAIVKLQRIGTAVPDTTETDAAGHFRFEVLEPNSYLLTAACSGFVDSVFSQHPVRPVARLVVAAGQTVSGISLRLTPYGSLAGRVLDEDGRPLPEVSVEALRFRYEHGVRILEPHGRVVTDHLGKYRIDNLAEDIYYLLVRPWQRFSGDGNGQPITGYTDALYPGTTDLAGADPLNVVAGSALTGCDFRLSRAAFYQVRGRAIDALREQPLHSGTLVAGVAEPVFPTGGFTANISVDGGFELPALATGAYSAMVVPLGPGGEWSYGLRNFSVIDRNLDVGSVTFGPQKLDLQGRLLVDGATGEFAEFSTYISLLKVSPYGSRGL